jgi:hypothetical protein
MPRKKSISPVEATVAAPIEAEVKEEKVTKKAAKPAARRTRPPLAPEVYVESGSKQYDITNIVEHVKEDYRATHKVGVQSCRIYIKPEEGVAYYVVNKVEGKVSL